MNKIIDIITVIISISAGLIAIAAIVVTVRGKNHAS